MLYVIHVKTGTEISTITKIKKNVPTDLFTSVYTPLREKMFKVNNEWIAKQSVLFSGYIFVDSNDIFKFYQQLNNVSGYTKLISVDGNPIAVTDEEMVLIKSLVNADNVMNVSEAIIVGDEVIVEYGPLQGLEGYIVDINRHKRKAWIETELFGRKQKIEVALNVTSRK